MDVLIVGAGAMGTWFGSAIDADVTFADLDHDAATAAAAATGGSATVLEDGTGAGVDGTPDADEATDTTDTTNAAGATDAYDAVCLAVPMTHITEAIAAHASRAERAVVDVSGVMAAPIEAMQRHAPDCERVSLHPLFAPARAPGSIAVVRDADGPATTALLDALAARGNELVETTAREHDDAMETVQAMTHATVLSFALAAESVPDGFETPIYEQLRTLAEHVTAGTPRVYADIQATFEGAEQVAAAAGAIADADATELESLYRDATAQWHEDATGPSDGQPVADSKAEETDR
ncbi:prephenate dehydrogenase/arogenate dehydrogenase family protein [Natrialba asiatica]|uniref:Prephenate dehydrogenase n=1 Tax=Natrialba asiatica (strain ATCC 700177 / DSM 12278 / JCM 9576 / FERM P-10747 / NBRC 102637 / 172P1) TaxID=29540 RepID=M0ANJ8_NATA1|nr:prephenate dehydrogenase/arogenate dehydrogenase family protein [Natrialba asiatica]ELZ00090.1 prephenate dehydrogenase [Natrialba asiatica DSM 12278]